jgi:hypothetical protein
MNAALSFPMRNMKRLRRLIKSKSVQNSAVESFNQQFVIFDLETSYLSLQNTAIQGFMVLSLSEQPYTQVL